MELQDKNATTRASRSRGLHDHDLPGAEPHPDKDPAEQCLARLLRTFFPSHVGENSPHQARPYIRTSAVGRGALPPKSPRPVDLISALESLGFVDGGRQGHLYAPWSSVAGRKSARLRGEMSKFLRDGTRSPAVEALLDRIRRVGNW
jgi:hypothetical protein